MTTFEEETETKKLRNGEVRGGGRELRGWEIRHGETYASQRDQRPRCCQIHPTGPQGALLLLHFYFISPMILFFII